MTSLASAPPATRRWPTSLYRTATGLFCLLFVFSAGLSIVDPAGTVVVLERLGFPLAFLYPQVVAKLLGVVAILSRRSRTLTSFAFAGFLYDLLLALSAHLAVGDPDVWLAVGGLVIWVAGFAADRNRFPTPPLR